MNYRTQCCGPHDPVKLSRIDDDDYLSRLIAKYIREVFEERKVSEAQRRRLWNFYNNELNEAFNLGYSPDILEYDEQLAHQLKYNIAEFSAFKETSFKKQVEAALLDDAGNIRSWSEFRAAAKDLGLQYNRRWLKTEYNQTIAQAQSVERWQQIEADQDLYPNLQYMTIGDARVRAEHKDWHGLILPVNHSFWQTHMPPNDWGCRCYVKQTIEEESPLAPEGGNLKEEFANNPALTGKLYKSNAYEKGLNKTEVNEAKALAKENFEKGLNRDENYKTFEKLKKSKDYTDVEFDLESGGMKATHKNHLFQKNSGKYEKQGRDLIFKNGNSIILESEVGKPDGQKYVDGLLNGLTFDHSAIISDGKNAVKRALYHSEKKQAQIAVLHFVDKDFYSSNRLYEGIKKFKGVSQYNFKEIWVLIDNEIHTIIK